jgi:S-adenosylmethionine hydrolase
MDHSKIAVKRKKNSRSNIIALITDFGLQDQYVAAMKGVILSINPKALVVDISHEVQPHRFRQAGYLLWSVYRFFPKDTLFVSVVDPGVGSGRHIFIAKSKGYTFLTPDNGLLDFILSEQKAIELFEVTQQKVQKYLPKEVALTFHGRDIFAPLAAYLSKGTTLGKLGEPFKAPTKVSLFVSSQSDSVHPCILNVDRFGNIITNLALKDVDQSAKQLQAVSVGRNLVSRWINFYDEAPENTPCLIIGSNGLVEVSIKNNNAAYLLNANLDTPLKIYWR